MNSFWFLIFHHSNKNDKYFDDVNIYFNLEWERFSILNELTDDLKYKGKFEFLYEAPSLNQYLRWKQSKNPLEINDVDEVEGLEIYLDSTMSLISKQGSKFAGLSRSNSSLALLDGTHNIHFWYYSVGQYRKDNQNEGLPAATWTDEISLWIRIPGPILRTSKAHIRGKFSHIIFPFLFVCKL